MIVKRKWSLAKWKIYTKEFQSINASMLSDDGKESNTAKGEKISTECNGFKETLFSKKIIKRKMKIIQRKKHKIGLYEINKMSLLCFDDKRFVLDDGIHTIAYFYKGVKKIDSHRWS